MKKFLFMLMTLLLVTACNQKAEVEPAQPQEEFVLQVGDEVLTEQTEVAFGEYQEKIDLLTEENAKLAEELKLANEQMEVVKADLKEVKEGGYLEFDVYMNARKIEKIKYYINITEKTPTNKKFFYGWIKRTMDES